MNSVSRTLKELFSETVENMIQDNLDSLAIEGHDSFVATKGELQDDAFMPLDRIKMGDDYYYLNARIAK